jgi:hypothetical protein
MNAIELNENQITRVGRYPAPNVPNYNSLFFHHLTKGNDTSTLYDWGNELTRICEEQKNTYYYFFNDFGTKINVYPNEVIENWWSNR